jgi:phosphorylcholine metabolism protein LicD
MNNKVEDIEQVEVNNIYDLLQIIVCELDKNKIDYIMTGGTLLGTVRNKGLIPYDDDGDIVILNEEVKIDDVLKILKSKTNIISYIGLKGNVIIVKFKDWDTCIDIFFMKNKNGVYNYKFPFNIQYPNEWYNYDELYPLKNYNFGPLVLKGPNDPIKYLDRTYPNWYNKEERWNHKSLLSVENKSTSNFVAKLPDNDFILKQCTGA